MLGIKFKALCSQTDTLHLQAHHTDFSPCGVMSAVQKSGVWEFKMRDAQCEARVEEGSGREGIQLWKEEATLCMKPRAKMKLDGPSTLFYLISK